MSADAARTGSLACGIPHDSLAHCATPACSRCNYLAHGIRTSLSLVSLISFFVYCTEGSAFGTGQKESMHLRLWACAEKGSSYPLLNLKNESPPLFS